MPLREGRRELAVSFFRPGRVKVAGAKSGFDMTDRNALVKSGKRRREGGGSVAVHQNGIWPPLQQYGFEAQQDAAGDVMKILPGAS